MQHPPFYPTHRYTATWDTLAGLRLYLAVADASRRAPLWLGVASFVYALRGRLSPTSVLAIAGACYGLQSVVGWAVGLLVVPGGRETLFRLRQVRDSALLARVAGGSVKAAVAPIVGLLSNSAERLDPARAALLAFAAAQAGGAERIALTCPDGAVLDGVLTGGAGLRRLAASCAPSAGAGAGAGAGVAGSDSIPPPAAGDAARDAASGCRGVLLYFGGNGEHYEMRPDLVAEWGARRKLALCLVNYRGVGRSGVGAGAGAGAGVGAGLAFAASAAAAAVSPLEGGPERGAFFGRGEWGCSRDGGLMDAVTALAYVRFGLGVPAGKVVVMGHSLGGAFAAEACRFFPGVLCISDRSFSKLSTVALFHTAAALVVGSTATAWWAGPGRSAFLFVLRHVACWELDSTARWDEVPRGCKLVISSDDDAVIPPPAQLIAGLLGRDPAAVREGVGAVLRMLPRDAAEDAHNGPFSPRETEAVAAAIRSFLSGQPLPDGLVAL